jgi:hypothetical protein
LVIIQVYQIRSNIFQKKIEIHDNPELVDLLPVQLLKNSSAACETSIGAVIAHPTNEDIGNGVQSDFDPIRGLPVHSQIIPSHRLYWQIRWFEIFI